MGLHHARQVIFPRSRLGTEQSILSGLVVFFPCFVTYVPQLFAPRIVIVRDRVAVSGRSAAKRTPDGWHACGCAAGQKQTRIRDPGACDFLPPRSCWTVSDSTLVSGGVLICRVLYMPAASPLTIRSQGSQRSEHALEIFQCIGTVRNRTYKSKGLCYM